MGSIPACAGEPTFPEQSPGTFEVYPRVCGGTALGLVAAIIEHGLSPRVRGNQELQGLWRSGQGSIPACAGEPAGGNTSTPLSTVYPRVCGGTGEGDALHQVELGLSPRVRGNHNRAYPYRTREGSIPACAGEPCRAGERQHGSLVYPRVCGGTVAVVKVGRASVGLSPRVRGNLASHLSIGQG